MRRVLVMLVVLAMAALLLLPACGPSPGQQSGSTSGAKQGEYTKENPLVIRLGCTNSPTDSSVRSMQKWAEILAERSGGRIKMEVYPGSQLGGNREGVLALQEGTLEMWYLTPLSVAGFDPRLQLAGLPGLFPDEQTAEKFYRDGWIGDLIEQYALENGMRRIAVGEPNFVYLYANPKAGFVPSLEKFKGIKLRIVESPLMKIYFEKIGAIPTPMPWGEIYTSLQRGVIDGMLGNLVWPVAAGFHEVANHITLLPYFYFPSDWFYSEKLWQKVPDDLKQIIMGTVKEFEDLARAEFAKEGQSNVEKMKAQGVQFYEPTKEELQKFRQGSLKIWEDYAVQVWGQDVVNRLKTEVIGIGS